MTNNKKDLVHSATINSLSSVSSSDKYSNSMRYTDQDKVQATRSGSGTGAQAVMAGTHHGCTGEVICPHC